MLDLSLPKVMGILNVTPDSFSDGGKFNSIDDALNHTERMINEGADIIDIGGMSSRPGAKIISSDEEFKRIKDILREIINHFPQAIISIDTIYGETARKTLDMGAHIINDISAFEIDKTLVDVVSEYKCPYVLMHMQGTPSSMQSSPEYNNVLKDVTLFLERKIDVLLNKNVQDIIIDPGFGFGKTREQNYQLLKGIHILKKLLDLPILVGLSRKSMLFKPLGISPNEMENATTVANTISLINGANIIRTHNVKQAKEAIKIVDLYQQGYV